jgi:hypothetical protein
MSAAAGSCFSAVSAASSEASGERRAGQHDDTGRNRNTDVFPMSIHVSFS